MRQRGWVAAAARRCTEAGPLRVLAAFVCIVAGGCGRPQTRLQGVVTIDGQPVAKAILQFSPERRDGPTAVAVTDPAGRYAVVVKPVPFRVTVVAQRVTGQKRDDANPGGGMVDVLEDVVPARFGDLAKTPLRAEPVAEVVNTVDFPLSAAQDARSAR